LFSAIAFYPVKPFQSETSFRFHFFSLDEKKRNKEKSSQNKAGRPPSLPSPAVLPGPRAGISRFNPMNFIAQKTGNCPDFLLTY